MNNCVEHEAIVVKSDPQNGKVDVKVQQNSACATCHAKRVCHSGDRKETIFSLSVPNAEQYVVGQSVKLSITTTSLLSSVFFAYIFPLLILLAVFFTIYYLTPQYEGLQIVSALLATGVYYLILYLLRNKFENKISVSIHSELRIEN
ncbi:MAG: SoxR reducing system RseC family protein [Bacteroidales bacterium]|jgi:sigma-E factor negative regulatory protein RseC|nr:SoxR reducing system RseC family protein [Bacteroidales bacterium]